MTRRIFKYPLTGWETIIQIPAPFEPLCVYVQGDKIQVWVKVNDMGSDVPVTFYMVPTGGEIPTQSKYVATVHTPPTVWHVFYRAD